MITQNLYQNKADVSTSYYFSYNFSQSASYEINLNNVSNVGAINKIQSVFIDNSDNPFVLTIITNPNKQILKIPAGFQGIFPIYLDKNNGSLNILNGGTSGEASLLFLTVYQNYAIWNPADQTTNFNFNGSDLLVSDPVLENIVNPDNSINTREYLNYGLNTYLPKMAGASAGYNQLSATGSFVLVPASTGYTPVVKSAYGIISGNATLATAGTDVLTISAYTTALIEIPLYVPAAASGNNFYFPIFQDSAVKGILSENIIVSIGTALTAGFITVYCTYDYL